MNMERYKYIITKESRVYRDVYTSYKNLGFASVFILVYISLCTLGSLLYTYGELLLQDWV